MRFTGNGITNCYPDQVEDFISITVLIGGVHLATVALPRRRLVRMAVSLILAGVVALFPLRVEYRSANGKLLVDHLEVLSEAEDGVILTGASGALVAFYGPWTFTVAADDQVANGTGVTINRERTLYLPEYDSGASRRTDDVMRGFLSPRPDRVWVLYFHTPRMLDVNGPLVRLGYTLHEVAAVPDGVLYLALAAAGPVVDAGSRIECGGVAFYSSEGPRLSDGCGSSS